MSKSLYPLKVSHICHEKMWGGTRLSDFVMLPESKLIGEVSLVSDAPNGSRILNGHLKGNSLLKVIKEFGRDLLGSRSFYNSRFPVHLKFLHANEHLSIQVHPDDEYATKHEKALSGKAEAWYILHAEPGAEVKIGFLETISQDQVRKSAVQGFLPALLKSYNVKVGDAFFLPPGTIHSLGAGVVLAEIQQNSQITYRLFDYNRVDQKTGKKRRLNLKKALDVLDYSKLPNAKTVQKTVSRGTNKITTLVKCPSFCAQNIFLHESFITTLTGLSAVIYTVVQGYGSFCYGDRKSPNHLDISKGETVIIPAVLDYCELVPIQSMKVLRFFIP